MLVLFIGFVFGDLVFGIFVLRDFHDFPEQFMINNWLYKSFAHKPWLTVYRASTGFSENSVDKVLAVLRIF